MSAPVESPTPTATQFKPQILLTLEVSMQEKGPQMAATKFEVGKPPQNFLYRGSNKACTIDGMIAEITPILRAAKWA